MKVGESIPSYEIVDYDPLRLLSCREFLLPVFPSPYHQHSEIEITGICSSHGMLHVGGEVSSFDKGDCFLLGSKLPHKFYNNPTESKHDQWAHSIVLQFNHNCFGDDFFKISEFSEIRKLLNQANRGLCVRGGKSEAILTLLSDIKNSSGMLRASYFLRLLHEFSIVDEIEFLMPMTQYPFSTQSTNRMDLITRYLYEHLDQKVTLDDLARICDMNRSSFSRFFKSATGRSLTSYVHEIKYRETCRLLSQTDKPITEIAFECGYENLSTFNRCFKRYSHLTPKVFRSQSRELHKV